MENVLQILLDRVIEFERNLNDYIRQELEKYSQDMLQMLYDQLQEGKTAHGEDLRPYYSEDNYFKSAERAYNYAKWKEKITPNPKRHWDVPNLYIDGTFYNDIGLRFDDTQYVFYSLTSYAREIMQKYGADNFDHDGDYRDELGWLIIPALREKLSELIKQ